MLNALNVDIEIKPSFEEVAEKFRRVDIKAPSQKALAEYAFTVERFSKVAAPVDTGRMRSSIMTDIGDMRARVAPHVFYALFVHEGTKYMRAQPFMSIGLGQANARLFSGSNPFKTHIQKEFNDKLK